MTSNDEQPLEELRREARRLRLAVYFKPDPAADPALLEQLADVEVALAEQEEKARPATITPISPTVPATEAKIHYGRFLGPETTGLKVTTTVRLNPIPTSIYHLLDPETDPLVTVVVENMGRVSKARRVRVKAQLEALSAETVRTVEIDYQTASPEFRLLPTLLPERARLMTEVQRATLHVLVTDLDNDRVESHDTYSLLCLARNSGVNAVIDPATGLPKDLTAYYGAWVTPYADSVQTLLRQAAEHAPGGILASYQRDATAVEGEVEAIFKAVNDSGLTYVNSVLDYGNSDAQLTQRTRLPREVLAVKSANCLDGALLMASLLEGASLNPVLVFVPGHAFVGWQSGPGTLSPYRYLETTMIRQGDFKAACASGESQYRTARRLANRGLREHRLRDLRSRGIFPME